MMSHNGLYRIRVELLAAEHIQVHIVILFNKVRDDIGSFYQLDQSVPGFVSCAKVNDLWFAVCYHIYLLDEVECECRYCSSTPDGLWATTGRVDDSMQTPFHYTETRDYSSQEQYRASSRQAQKKQA